MTTFSETATRLSRRAGPFVENVLESTAACLMTMVQGNLIALTAEHWSLASQTGIAAGTIASAAILVGGIRKRASISIVLGAVTGVVDFVVHGALLAVVLDAVVTGIGAAVLSLLFGVSSRYVRARLRVAR